MAAALLKERATSSFAGLPVVGGIYSALGAQKLPPPGQRADFAARIGRAVAPHAPFIEHVPVRILAGRTPG